ncbi:MAG: hypothetical protein FWG54_03650 [Bacteroidetes bacterium]|nr:hypothetical protein [Bacteroidota bacterium]
MDDSIIAIIAAVAIGLFQLVNSVNKKKRTQEQRMHSRPQRDEFFFDLPEKEEPAFSTPFFEASCPPESPSLPTTAPVKKREAEEVMEVEDAEEEASLLQDFTPLNAILFSEVMHPKWKV